MAKYCALFSGSSGNSTYLGTSHGGVLVDAGVSAKRLKESLLQRGIDPGSLCGICITHEHIDHTRGLKVFLKQFPMPVYATRGTAQALEDHDLLPPGATVVPLTGEAVDVGDMAVVPFLTPHDSAQSCGFRVTFPDGRTAAIATDMGFVAPSVVKAITGADLVHIESNHDVRMLQCGPYPYSLKCRVLGRGGHLSNEACAELLPTLLQSGSTRFMLSHLSRENNVPDLAYGVSAAALCGTGAVIGNDCLLGVAAPEGADGVTVF